MSITITGIGQYEAWTRRELPAVEQVRPGIWTIPVPFPDPSTRYTLCYLLQSEGTTVLIDPGMDTPAGWIHLQKGLAEAGSSAASIEGILVTHFHPDHLGLANRLRSLSAAWLALGADERYYRPNLDLPEAAEENKKRLITWGVPAARHSELQLTGEIYSLMKSLALAEIELHDGDTVPVGSNHLRVVTTPGHSPGHVCFIDDERKLIFSGDHLLPSIRPHVLLDRAGLENPLEAHLDSLARTRHDADFEVLPAHQYRFRGAGIRSAALEQWHQTRGEEIRAVIDELQPQNLWTVAKHLKWARGWNRVRGPSTHLALGETASHVLLLQRRGISVPAI
jgi:glyoxylase-like metal-dependent hydrolase (beta-lactamase superfamily II)